MGNLWLREGTSLPPVTGRAGTSPRSLSCHPLPRQLFGLNDLLSPLTSPCPLSPIVRSARPAGCTVSSPRPWSCCRPAPVTSMSARTGPSASWCGRSPPAAAPRASLAHGARSSSPSTSWARTPTWNWPQPRSGPRPTSLCRCASPRLSPWKDPDVPPSSDGSANSWGGGPGPTPCRGFYLLTPLGNSHSTNTCQAGNGDSVGDKTAKPVAQDRRARKWSMTTLGDVGACRWGCNPSLLGRIREGSPEGMITKLRSEG